MKQFVLWFVLLSIIVGQSATVEINSVIANMVASHRLIVLISGLDVPADSKFKITYPSHWDLSTATSSTTTADFCQTSCDLSKVTVTNTAQTLSIDNLIPNIIVNTEQVSLAYTITNIKNPSYSSVNTININLNDPSDNIITSFSVSVTIQAAQMGCTVTLSNTTVSASSSYTFEITPSIDLPSNGFLKYHFPTNWFNSGAVIPFNSITCSSPTSTTLICTQQTAKIIKVSSIFTTDQKTSFNIIINNIINPGSTESNNELQLIYYTLNLQAISKCNVNISSIIRLQHFQIKHFISGKVKQDIQASINLNISFPTLLTDQLIIKYPSSVNLSPLNKARVQINPPSSDFGDSTILFTNVSQKITMHPFAATILNFTYSIQIFTILMPQSTQPSAKMQFEILRNNFSIAYESCCEIIASVGQSQLQVDISDRRLLSLATYTFIITLNTLQTVLDMQIILGSQYTLTLNNIYNCRIANIKHVNLKCQAKASNIILITNLPINSLRTQVSFELLIQSLMNPQSLSSSLSIKTRNLNSYAIQQSNLIDLQFTAINLTSVSLNSSSYIVGESSIYSFLIDNSIPLPSQCQLRIYIVQDVQVLSNLSCQIGSVSKLCSYINNSYVSLLLGNSSILAHNLKNNAVKLNGIRNPSSLKPTSSFAVEIYFNSSLIQILNEGIFITMIKPASFASLNLLVGSQLTNEKTSYKIQYSIEPIYATLALLELLITWPQQYTVLSCLLCSSWNQFSVSLNTIEVNYQLVQNPATITIINPITVQLIQDGYISLQSSILKSTWLLNSLELNVIYNHSIMGEPVEIKIQLLSPICQNCQYFIVKIPSQFILGTVVLKSNSNVSFSTSGYSLNITLHNYDVQNITFIVTGISTPLKTPSSSWIVDTYAAGFIQIASSNSTKHIFLAQCGLFCRTCLLITCYSCYSNALISNLNFLSDKACVTSCNSSSYAIDFICYICSSPCLSCQNESNFCTSCIQNYTLFNFSCRSSCPVGWWQNSSICQQCKDNCITCTSQLTCQFCANGFVLDINKICTNSCNVGYYNYSHICRACSDNCTSCNTATCLTCSIFYYLVGDHCLSQCPSPYFIASDLISCELCQSPCASCFNTSKQCITCENNFFLLSATCVNSCTSTYFPNQFNICQACVTPCASCSSKTNCSTCISTYFFYAATNQCFQNCPNKTIMINQTCQQCLSPCLQCSNSVNNCTLCIEEYFLTSINTCTLNCTFPEFAIDRKCLKCVQPCMDCTIGQPYNCITCINSFYLLQKTCYLKCPSTTFQDGNKCSSCNSGCLQCQNTSSACLSCLPGLFLYQKECLSSCPIITPILYEYQSQCIECQPQCVSCLSSPVSCTSCTNISNYWNPLTLQCTQNCTNPYFINKSQCQICQLPCKNCSTSVYTCSECYNGKFLYNNKCQDQCPSAFYSENNTCWSCPLLCSACQASKCSSCKTSNLLYKGQCYSSCPNQAPYQYQEFCRNCLQPFCLLCSQQNQCVTCFPNYLLLEGQCLDKCPNGYQPDLNSGLLCILNDQNAFLSYQLEKQKQKIFITPCLILLFIFIPIVIYAKGNKVMLLMIITGILQIPAHLTFTIFCFWYASFVFLLATIIIMVIALIISLLHTIFAFYLFQKDIQFQNWISYGNNKCRVYLVFLFGLLCHKVIYLLFTGFLKLPFTSFRLSSLAILNRLNVFIIFSIIFIESGFVCIAIATLLDQQPFLSNKLFYSGIDAIVIDLLCIIFTSIQLWQRNQFPPPYTKYIIQKISNLSLMNDSQGPQQWDSDDEDQKLHRSNSESKIRGPLETNNIQYMSTFDPSDYENVVKIKPEEINAAIKKGHFRRNKKKIKKKRQFNLDVISEEQSDEQKIVKKKKKKKLRKKQNNGIGFMNNYMYWKPSQKIKNTPQNIFKQNKDQIMSKINQKQSEFDSITNNDIIFQQQFSNEQSQLDYYKHNDSKRQLKMPKKSLINNNYPYRNHLDFNF